jgi:hypothetical protein
VGECRDTRRVAQWLAGVLATVPKVQHFVTNVDIGLAGDRAEVGAVFFNPYRGAGEREIGFRSGWHTHDFVRTPDGWRSQNLVEVIESSVR